MMRGTKGPKRTCSFDLMHVERASQVFQLQAYWLTLRTKASTASARLCRRERTRPFLSEEAGNRKAADQPSSYRGTKAVVKGYAIDRLTDRGRTGRKRG
jgi:hypothetical protein